NTMPAEQGGLCSCSVTTFPSRPADVFWSPAVVGALFVVLSVSGTDATSHATGLGFARTVRDCHKATAT
ncbi:MAG: hypothetical protein B7Z30_17085, partial [Rhizobiales bacterium 12-68-15]